MVNPPRLVSAPIEITFDAISQNETQYKREFDSLQYSNEDIASQYLWMAKSKGDMRESDHVIITMLAGLYKKIDELKAEIRGETQELAPLAFTQNIESIGYDFFMFDMECLREGESYYGRLRMPIVPKREIAVMFVSVDTKLAKISAMHEKDRSEWDGYVVARERAVIRLSKKDLYD